MNQGVDYENLEEFAGTKKKPFVDLEQRTNDWREVDLERILGESIGIMAFRLWSYFFSLSLCSSGFDHDESMPILSCWSLIWLCVLLQNLFKPDFTVLLCETLDLNRVLCDGGVLPPSRHS